MFSEVQLKLLKQIVCSQKLQGNKDDLKKTIAVLEEIEQIIDKEIKIAPEMMEI